MIPDDEFGRGASRSSLALPRLEDEEEGGGYRCGEWDRGGDRWFAGVGTVRDGRIAGKKNSMSLALPQLLVWPR